MKFSEVTGFRVASWIIVCGVILLVSWAIRLLRGVKKFDELTDDEKKNFRLASTINRIDRQEL